MNGKELESQELFARGYRQVRSGEVVVSAQHVEALAAACRAALKYHEANRQRAREGESWVRSDDLDALYFDWITKAAKALNIPESTLGFSVVYVELPRENTGPEEGKP